MSEEPGGFLQPALVTPPASDVASSTYATLPHPRSHPLKPGSSKESSFIAYVDRKLLDISRRHETRHYDEHEDNPESTHENKAYKSFADVAGDLGKVTDIVWVSGTPSLQIPYLLTIVLVTCEYLPSYPFSAKSTFTLLSKLDVAFSSLLKGINIETGEDLPGFGGGRGKLSTTEKVRLRGLVERTRVVIVEVAGKGGSVAEESQVSQTESEDDTMTEGDNVMTDYDLDRGHGGWEMEVARVYERIIVELGQALDMATRSF